MRQVLVKVAPPVTLLLSGMVTSVTKDALFVQSGGLVGAGVPTVAVSVGRVADVSVAAISLDTETDTSVAVVPAGISVVATTGGALEVGAGAGVGDWVPHAVNNNADTEAITKSFLFILHILFKTSSSAIWIFQAGRWRFVLRTFHASAPGLRPECATIDILQVDNFSTWLP